MEHDADMKRVVLLMDNGIAGALSTCRSWSHLIKALAMTFSFIALVFAIVFGSL